MDFLAITIQIDSSTYVTTDNSIEMGDNVTPMAQALQFLHENPLEKPITAARIYNVNPNTLNTKLRRAKAGSSKPHGGHNKVLSEAQIQSIYQYVEDSYMRVTERQNRWFLWL